MTRTLKQTQLTSFLLVLQGIGILFFALFSVAYWIPLQTVDLFLFSDPLFHLVISVVGGLFLLLFLAAVVLYVVAKPEKTEA